ncbi:radical SAM protein [Amycolatopsis sp. GM8]|uniref:B12-binding domain-containing radical SAM protein n=1 Tax=Amycolatopsis sp. GM8 TaxID=2896530 RepID=UPI001F02B4B4|nr:radical SAM protein [Amycolatopsis sp. GM8]
MKVLVCWPPHVPSYFNAGHHLPVFSIAAFLRRRGHEVDALDAGALNVTWKDFADRVFLGDYDLVVLVNDFDVVEGVRRAADYIRALCPRSAVMTVGRLSYQTPGFFRGLALDAVGHSGDYEAAVSEVLRWLAAGRPDDAGLAGVSWRAGDGWRGPQRPGTWLPADDWVLPDVDEIPYVHYEQLYIRDQNKFCGIPERRELVVPVARGCPVGCDFCDVPVMQGLRERRMDVDRVVSYIRECFARSPFEYVAFYAPTFTLDKRWVRRLCDALAGEPRRYPWKCATTMFHLDADLVRRMGEAGCVRISVGVETFEEEAEPGLPTVKKSARARFDEVARWCLDAGVELNCFLIVGLPGTTPDGARRAMDVINGAGARVRPTLYTPYDRIRADMTEREVSAFNRQLFVDEDEIRATGIDPGEYLAVLYRKDDYVTPSTARIPGLTVRLPAAGA